MPVEVISGNRLRRFSYQNFIRLRRDFSRHPVSLIVAGLWLLSVFAAYFVLNLRTVWPKVMEVLGL